jgi:hypothetical protein
MCIPTLKLRENQLSETKPPPPCAPVLQGALQLYLELYTIKRRLASMGLFDLAAVTLKRLLLAPDQQETWGDWVESLLEATFGDEEEDGGGAVLRKQLVQVGRDICIVVKSLAASSSPQVHAPTLAHTQRVDDFSCPVFFRRPSHVR